MKDTKFLSFDELIEGIDKEYILDTCDRIIYRIDKKPDYQKRKYKLIIKSRCGFFTTRQKFWIYTNCEELYEEDIDQILNDSKVKYLYFQDQESADFSKKMLTFEGMVSEVIELQETEKKANERTIFEEINSSCDYDGGTYKYNSKFKTLVFHESLPDYDLGTEAPWKKFSAEAVIVEEGIVTIGDNAFSGMNFRTLILPNSLKKIGKNSFSDCEKLTKIDMQETDIQEIDDYAFANCKNLKRVSFSKCIKSIGEYAFYRCENLNEVNFCEGLETIGKSAFASCYKILRVNLPETLKIVPELCFSNCFDLYSVTIGSETLKTGCFLNCKDLSVEFSPKIRFIENLSFIGCQKLLLHFKGEAPIVQKHAFHEARNITILVKNKASFNKEPWENFRMLIE